MSNYIYILPYKIENVNNNPNQEKIITQTSSLIIGKNPSLEIMKQILNVAHGYSVTTIYEKYKDRISITSFQKLLHFFEKNHLIFLCDEILDEGEVKFLEFISHYTTSLHKCRKKIKHMMFQLAGMKQGIQYIKEILDGFSLKYKIFNENEVNILDEDNIVLACFDSTDLMQLYSLAEKVEKKKGLLWMFTLFYDDSFLISPILNQINYTDFYSLKNQVDLEALKEKGIARNGLIQKMGICEMILNILTSIMKLNLHTSYDKMIIYDSLEKSLLLEHIYYFPLDVEERKLNLQRWDDEK